MLPSVKFMFSCSLVVMLLPTGTFSSNILFFHVFATSSHRTAVWPLAEKLADSGHNVSYIFPVTQKIGYHPNITEITPSKMVPILKDFLCDFDINIRLQNKELEWVDSALKETFKLCEAFYDSPEIQEWLANPSVQFDLIFVDGSLGECGYGLVHRFNAKMILVIPVIPPFLADGLGIVPESSSIPDLFFHPDPKDMTLLSRTISTIIPLVWRYKFLEYLGKLETLVWAKLNVSSSNSPIGLGAVPSFLDIESNTSLVMYNGHYVEEYPLSLPPMFVSISGLWCSKSKLPQRKPLPEKLAKFIEKSEGFFYVSFGSAVIASGMPLEMRNNFFHAFRKFPQHRFFWRWTGPVPEDTPENAMLLPWFPQHDILAHSKIKGFLTQAGRPSSQEAICHGVPLITVPIFADQDYNADRLEYIGAAIKIDINNLTESALTNSFAELLSSTNPYTKNMKKMSVLSRDRPMDPLEYANYWAEYVLRHKDTVLLKPLGMKQTWYQRRLLDVYAFLSVLVFGILATVALIVCFIGKRVLKLVSGNDNERLVNIRKPKVE